MFTPSVFVFLLVTAAAYGEPPPLPPPCLPFDTGGGLVKECAVELFAGHTYTIFTECSSVRGDTELTLVDPNGRDVAFNDGFPFCPGDSGASLEEFYVECDLYGARALFTILQGCFEDTKCSGKVIVEYSGKQKPVDCVPTPPPPMSPVGPRGPFMCTLQDETCEALGDFYYATNGNGWSNRAGWERAVYYATNYTTFVGTEWSQWPIGPSYPVKLFRLSLPWNGLKGQLPESISRLTSLQRLELSNNKLTGTIPQAISLLPNLFMLDLGANLLAGSIPPNMNRTGITSINLSRNTLSGAIPPDLLRSSGTAISTVDLSNNSFSGTLDSLCGQRTIRGSPMDLRLSSNKFSGTIPTCLAAVGNILALSDNQLSGSIPSTFGMTYDRLSDLNLRNNQLSGTLPDNMGKLVSLRALDLRNNKLSGSFPLSLEKLTNLNSLLLADSGLCGHIVPMPHQPDDGPLPDCPRRYFL